MKHLFAALLVVTLIVLDVFFFPVSSDLRLFGIIALYTILVRRFAIRSVVSFGVSLFLFLLSYLYYVRVDPSVFASPIVPISERLAVWTFLFLVIGVVQKWRE